MFSNLFQTRKRVTAQISKLKMVKPTRIPSVIEVDLEGNNIPDLPAMPDGRSPGEINLLKAVYDRATAAITEIDGELYDMEIHKRELELKRKAYEEMLVIAKKYVDLIRITVTTSRR